MGSPSFFPLTELSLYQATATTKSNKAMECVQIKINQPWLARGRSVQQGANCSETTLGKKKVGREGSMGMEEGKTGRKS